MNLDSSKVNGQEEAAENNLPPIDCIVIGVNSAATLKRCLSSIKQSNYPSGLLTIFYVDGGSADNSVAIAQAEQDVQTLELNTPYPTPGLGRNRGWRAGEAPFVQFLDGDTILDPNWLHIGVTSFRNDIGAVSGQRKEMYPERTVFNWIGNQEWNGEAGFTDSFGGDVLITRQALETTLGYNEELVGGEDPELSRRISMLGWKILHLDCSMTRHDLAMTKISQYLKRAYRSGYGFAAVIHKSPESQTAFWQKEYFRIVIRGGGTLLLWLVTLLLGFFSFWSLFAVPVFLLSLAASFILLFFPRLARVAYFANAKKLSADEAKIYAWHCSIVVLPQVCGVVRFFWGHFTNRPLRNKRNRLATATLGAE
jgi:cellulose synthase/poly-beta-1,6-N-acetylglucosamine synthase-like glycosyltransferase